MVENISPSSSENGSLQKKIVIFASGNGSNAENIIKYFQQKKTAKVVHVLSNKADAKVLEKAKNLSVAADYFNRQEFLDEENGVIKTLKYIDPDIIVLAGFLWKFPQHIIAAFPQKIINIHPALLPKYGGKGMYGNFVHEAVVNNKEMESGISIHYVNENYDEGAMIIQKNIAISSEDTAETVAQKIHVLEYEWFPRTIEKLLLADSIDIVE